jgi:CRP/FNR family transcriptional regulator, cyclic AMP receptor protein
MLALPIGLRHKELFASVLTEPADHFFAPREVLFKEGERAEHAYYLVSGRVSIGVQADNGANVVVAERGPKDLIGEMSLVSGMRCARVQAIDAVSALRVSYGLIVQLVNSRPDFALAMYGMVTERLYEANHSMARLTVGV